MAYIARERILFNANVSKMKTQSNDDSITDDGASIKSFNSSVLGGGAVRSSTPLEMHKGSRASSESGLSGKSMPIVLIVALNVLIMFSL